MTQAISGTVLKRYNSIPFSLLDGTKQFSSRYYISGGFKRKEGYVRSLSSKGEFNRERGKKEGA